MYKIDEIARIVKIVLEELEKELPFLIPVGVSGRHIHISQEDMEILFGKDAVLTKMKDLKQPGEFASNEILTISGKKGSFDKVRILGPVRKNTQVELSLSDAMKLGVSALVRESGKLGDAGMIRITNPLTGVSIERKAAIAALRHIHMTPRHAEKLGVKDRQMVSVLFQGEREIVFNQVLLRVSDNFVAEMHVDTDEANAGGISNGMYGKILLGKGSV